MKRTTRKLWGLALITAIFLILAACGVTATPETAKVEENDSGLSFDNYYIIMPKLNVRRDPDTADKIGVVYAGQKVDFIESYGNYSTFNFQDEDGNQMTGATWTGAIAPAVRIHILEDAFIYHRPGQNRTELASISTWREPTDPDLLVLWEEKVNGESWLYVLSVEDCRAGYMSGSVPYEIVE